MAPQPLARRSRWGRRWLLAPAAAYLLVFFLLPLGRLLHGSAFGPELTARHYARFFETGLYAQVLLNTAKIAGLVTAACLALGYPLAYWLGVLPPRARRVVLFVVVVPFWTSLLVRSYAWLVLLQREGVVNRTLAAVGLIDAPLELAYNLFGAVCGITYMLLPMMVLLLRQSMGAIDRRLVVTALTLGASPGQAFRRVFFPLSLPGVAAGCTLVFVISFGYFITPALLGGRRETTIAMLIDLQMNQLFDWGFGMALAVILTVVVVAILFGVDRVIGIGRQLEGATQ